MGRICNGRFGTSLVKEVREEDGTVVAVAQEMQLTCEWSLLPCCLSFARSHIWVEWAEFGFVFAFVFASPKVTIKDAD